MNNRFYIFCLAALLLLGEGSPLQAQYRTRDTRPAVNRHYNARYNTGLRHLVGFYAEGGYSGFPTTINNLRMDKGFMTEVGMVYELQKHSFSFQLGAGFTYQQTSHHLLDMYVLEQPGMIDTQGDEYLLRYSILRSDATSIGYLDIPILFGQHFRYFYYLAGVKVGVNLFGKTYSTAHVTTTGDYERYIIPFSSMDNHGLRTYVPVERTAANLPFKADARLSAEIGLNFGDPKDQYATGFDVARRGETDIRYRIAAFADFGVLCYMTKDSRLPFLDIDENNRFDYEKFTLNHPLISSEANDKLIGNLHVGAKLTILFGAGKPYRCTTCRREKHKRINWHCLTCDDALDY